MRKLIEKLQHGFAFHGGGMPETSTPSAPAPPPPPAPPPTKTDNEVQQERKEALEKKKLQKGREKTLLAQTGSEGTKKKKTLLGS